MANYEIKDSEYFLRCAWEATIQERDNLKDQVAVLVAIKKGLEKSLIEAFEKIKEYEEKFGVI
jgi:phage shock protein A